MASSPLHKRIAELFRELAVARADGSFGQYLLKLSRIDVLVLDDFAMAPRKNRNGATSWRSGDDRYQRRSTILTSQVPVAHWHVQIGDRSIAVSIMDRLVHNAHRIELDGESMRKLRGEETTSGAAAMSPTRMELKCPSGWFAAGREVRFAATLLSDSAFKLFVWTCLHAERNLGADSSWSSPI